MKLRRCVAISAIAVATLSAQAKVEHILPRPQNVELGSGFLPIGGTSVLNDPTKCELLADFVAETGTGGCPVTVTLVNSIDGAYDYQLADYDNEAYRLTINPGGINIEAVTAIGVIRATQTLIQIAEEASSEGLEAVTITDWPAFKLRGFMHDVGRSFITTDELIKEIELMSRFKVNTFHWHLTENQAWRFEVKAYPQLTSASSMTRFAGQYYTQDDCRRVMAAARRHGVTVIPEIDMPGHSEAFVRAMGYGMQTTNGKEALKKILEEVADVFADAPYIHIGADEQTITDGTFLSTMTSKIHSLGKKAVCWNPISGVTITSSTGFDMTQMWSTAGKKIAGVPNIDCRYNYTNHFDVFADPVGIYKSSIYYVERGNAEVAGTISCPWNDRKTPTQEDIIKSNNIYLNTLASAERAWIGGGKQYIEQGGTTLPNDGEEFEEFADFERRFLFHKAHSLSEEPIPYVKQTNVRWKITDPFPNGGDATRVFPPETETTSSSYTYNGTTYNTRMATGAGIYLRHTWGSTIPTFYGRDYSTGYTAYAYTYIYSPEACTAGAIIEFQNYGRSEKDTAPDAGKWDRKGSRIWLNDEEILPDPWTNTGKTITNEVDLGNENFTARAPKRISLNQGWNKVMIKLPYVAADGVRLNKWLYTFVVTDVDGRDALPGLIYSPSASMNPDAELLPAKIAEIQAWLEGKFEDLPGYYAPTDEVITLLILMSDTENVSFSELSEAFEAAKASVSDGDIEINQPVPGYYYYLYTPLRDSRYLTSMGSGSALMGQGSTSEAAQWRFEPRADGSYDMVNRADGSYISPNSANDTQLRTSAYVPASGWSVKPSDAPGYAILTNGTVQINQTNSGLYYKIYNWGNGTNISDTGCKYQFILAEGGVMGVKDPAADHADDAVKIQGCEGYIEISGGNLMAEVYSPMGVLLTQGCGVISMPPGLVIVKVGQHVEKVMVR